MSSEEERNSKHGGDPIGGRAVLFVAFAGFAALLCGLLSVLTATALKEQVREQIRSHLQDAVLLGASRIDAELHDTLVRPEQEGDPAYREIQRTLQGLQRSLEDIYYVYTMRRDAAGHIVFVVDEATNEEEIAHLGEIYEDAGPLLREYFVSLDRPLVEKQTYTDRWGTWLSGYAPFYGADGRRAGVLGMDIRADDIAAVQRHVFLTAGLVFVSILPLCAGLGWLLADRLSMPLRKLATEARNLIRWSLPSRSHADAVTEVKTLGTAIRALNRVLDGIRDIVIATDMEGSIVYANETATCLLGRQRDEILGQNVSILGEDSSRGATQGEILRTTREFGMWEGKIVNHDHDGREIVFESRTRLLCDDDGTPLGMVGMSTDITAKEQAEREHRALEAQLRQAQKLESIGTLAGGVAHEINNPINGIMNYAQLIRDRTEGQDETVEEFAGEIIHETERVAALVRNLLSFARQEKQYPSPVRLCDVVNGTLSLVRTILRHDQIAIEVDVPPYLPRISCCSQQIQQVVMNLVVNARDALNEKFSGADENKKISISATPFERDGQQWVRTTIEDHGPGIPVEVRERIFDPFFTTKSRDKGTGLGLAISYGIVSDHQGTLTVESKPGEWTRFHIDLPVDRG